MVKKNIESYRSRIRSQLEERHADLNHGVGESDTRFLVEALEREHRNGLRLLRARGLPLRFVQEFVAPLLRTNPDLRFLHGHSPQQLLDIAFDVCLEILEWSNNGILKDEMSFDGQAASFLSHATIRGYHQQPCTPATAIRRVRLVQGLWRAKKPPSILLLGDDDLVSFAFASQARWPTTVLELDSNVIETIGAMGISEAPINLIRHDLRSPLPKELHDRFDVVMADPMYTAEGLDIFLRSALTALGENPNRALFLSFNDRFLDGAVLPGVIRRLEEVNLALVEHLPRFNVYPIPQQRRRQLRSTAQIFFSDPLLHTILNIPVTFSDMYVLHSARERASSYGA